MFSHETFNLSKESKYVLFLGNCTFSFKIAAMEGRLIAEKRIRARQFRIEAASRLWVDFKNLISQEPANDQILGRLSEINNLCDFKVKPLLEVNQ